MKQKLISKIQSKYAIDRLICDLGFIAKPVLLNRKRVIIEYREEGVIITPVWYENLITSSMIDQIRLMIPIIIKEFDVYLDIVPIVTNKGSNKVISFNHIDFDKRIYPEFNSLDILLMIKEYLPELNPMYNYISSTKDLLLTPFFAINGGGIENIHHRCEKLKSSYNASSVSLQKITSVDNELDCETDYYLISYVERRIKNISYVACGQAN